MQHAHDMLLEELEAHCSSADAPRTAEQQLTSFLGAVVSVTVFPLFSELFNPAQLRALTFLVRTNMTDAVCALGPP